VGFIQLPVKPAPKVVDKAGAAKFPPRPGARPEVGRSGARPDFRQQPQRPTGPPSRYPQPGGGVRPSAPVTAGARPAAGKTGPAAFVPPTSGETITMKPPIVVRVLAELLKCKPFQLIRDLMELGVFANVNQTIEETVAQRLCSKYGFRFEVEKREKGAGMVHAPIRKQEPDPEDKVEDLKPRPPVVTIMGHVDHGKTTLLDVIRKSNVAAGEAGGITQHIGAYTISFPHPERTKEIQQITFLDTPGHAAFSAMRARGANVTDIVVLVVAANDGVMPQTEEAISHAAAAKVPIIVAVNKCDHPNANAMRVRQQLQEHGLVCEEWGGNTIFQDLSALTKKGVDKLLELILLQAEIMELKANPVRRAKGNVIESGLEPGGPTATVLVRKGTLKVGDIILCGQFWGKARALINEEGQRLKAAGPSVAVKLLGLNGVPEAGLEFAVVENEKMAREIASERAEKVRERSSEDRLKPKATLADLLKTLETSAAKVLRIVIRGDTQGSVEAIVEALKKIDSEKVTLEILQGAVGIITEADVNLASASKAIVIGFHTRVDSGAVDAAKREGVQIKLYSIIYELIDEVKNAMAGLLEPLSREVVMGAAEVRQIFSLSKGGNVAGCMVSNGRLVKGRCRVMRRKDLIFEGSISSLRRFQDEVTEVRAGLECGVRIDGFNEYHTGDSIECYSTEKIAQKL
jgi:translation initiation factor IF-2